MTTMADVARQAGVSVSTVSHVVNATRPIHPETRQRVLDAIAESGFVVNSMARALAGASTATVGLAMTAVSNFYFADMVAGIDTAVRSAGSTLLLADTHDDPEEELLVVRTLHQRRVDGVLLATATDGNGPALQYLRKAKIPVVLVDRCAAADFDQIGVENLKSTQTLTAHLIEHGHTRIGMISGVPGVSTTIERVQGYCQALDLAGMQVDRRLIVPGHSRASDAALAFDQLMTVPSPPTALVIGNNHMTIGALRALQSRGLKTPGDIALATFDDFDWSDVFTPRLTAIGQPIAEISERAVVMLMERIAGYSGPPRTERPDGIWRKRETCGCLVDGQRRRTSRVPQVR